jgi:hypothetical protein
MNYTGSLFERIVWSKGENTITLTRTMNADYTITNGKIEVDYAHGNGDDEYEFDGPDSEELQSLLDDDDFIESETFEDIGFEQTEYTLMECSD